MELRKLMVIGIPGILILGITALPNSFINNKKTVTEQFSTVHLVNLQSEDMEEEILSMMNEMNQTLKEMGYPNMKYEVWKERSGRDGRYSYIIQSTWPDQATYEEVHSHENYQATWEKHRSRYDELVAEDVYNRYIPLN